MASDLGPHTVVVGSFEAFRGGYPFRAEFCAPAKGWETSKAMRRGWAWRQCRQAPLPQSGSTNVTSMLLPIGASSSAA